MQTKHFDTLLFSVLTFNTAFCDLFDDFVLIVFELEIFKNIKEGLSVATIQHGFLQIQPLIVISRQYLASSLLKKKNFEL